MMTEQTISIEKMNADTTLWICDVDFWIDEVNDCQQLLEKNLSKMDDIAERKQLEQFQNQIIYYRDELLPEIKHDLVHHQKILKGNAKSEKLISVNEELNIRVTAIHEQMKERRKSINHFIKKL